MQAFINGAFVPEDQATVSIFDRGFLYGDGLFEAIRIYQGIPFRWQRHWARLERGAQFLKIQIPGSSSSLLAHLQKLIKNNQTGDAIARLTVTRGIGPRGYSPKGADKPSVTMTLHPIQKDHTSTAPQWRVITSSIRVPARDPIALHKTCNKLPNILARAEAEGRGADEALILNTRGEVTEAVASNLFWIENNMVSTTPLESGALPGVTREVILEICSSLKLQSAERPVFPEELNQMQGVFLTMSTLEIVEVIMVDGHEVSRSPLVPRLAAAFQKLVQKEIHENQ